MDNKKRVFTVLSIDGGGVRGVVPARILQEIEERAGKPIAELFDLVGGTSTGAILAGGLVVPDDDDPTKPKFSAKEMLGFYYRYAPRIFPDIRFKNLKKISSSTIYDPKPLEDALEKNFGDHKMKDSLTHLMIPATDIKNFRPVWIKYIKGEKDTSEEGWSSMLMRDAVRASTTAPTYFPAKYYQTTPHDSMPNVSHRHALIDGSFFAGNMMRRLLTQAKKLAPPDAEIVILHVGTGHIDNSLSPEEYNKLGPIGLVSKASGSILISLIVNMAIMDVAADIREEIGDRFISLDDFLDPDEDDNAPATDMDDSSLPNLKKLQAFAENIIQKNDQEINRLCGILKNREIAEEQHLESKKALQYIADLLAERKTVKSLTGLYTKVLRFSTDLDDELVERDQKLYDICRHLNEHHKVELDRVYKVLLDKRQSENRILNSIKEAGDDITNIGKKIVDPFLPSKDGDAPPPSGNDNKPPAASPKRSFGGPKFGG